MIEVRSRFSEYNFNLITIDMAIVVWRIGKSNEIGSVKTVEIVSKFDSCKERAIPRNHKPWQITNQKIEQ